MNRTDRQFIASLPGEPLAEPSCLTRDDQRRAWDDIVAACPDVCCGVRIRCMSSAARGSLRIGVPAG